ncbi:MAG: ABC transporter substrate-binding protein [Paracoccaceae bacterium]
MTSKGKLVAAALAAMLTAQLPGAAAAQELKISNFSYRTGPFAATGIPLTNGLMDYFTLLNERDGGIGGVKIDFAECETGYNAEKGIECYEKNKGDSIAVMPWSTGITLQLLPKTNEDRVPIILPGGGNSAMADGKVFQWVFNGPDSYWDAASMMLQSVGGKDLSGLKGKKVGFLYLDIPFGREPIPFIEAKAKEVGFELVLVPVGIKEMQNQSTQWLQIRRERPDYVLMWSWGAMNAAAVNEAIKTRFPIDRLVGTYWSAIDDDLQMAGDAGKGFRAISFTAPKPDAPVLAEVQKHVVDTGKSLSTEDQRAETLYQRGLAVSMMISQGIRAAQEHFGTSEINAEQMRWGMENIDITEAILEEAGMGGMLPPFKTSCTDHLGHSGGWILTWDGNRFQQSEELFHAERDAIAKMEEEGAAAYAEANAPWPVQTCDG